MELYELSSELKDGLISYCNDLVKAINEMELRQEKNSGEE